MDVGYDSRTLPCSNGWGAMWGGVENCFDAMRRRSQFE
jgi:hypothetical protein